MDALRAPSNLPDPKDRRETEAWLDRRSEKLADSIARSLKKVVTSAYERFLATLPETTIVSSLTAAGDFHAFDSIVGDWRLIYEKEIAPEIEETYLSGAMSAFTQAPGTERMTDEEVASWARVTNDQALSYMGTASNRLAGVGDTIWNDVRDRVSSAVASGMSNEELKDQIGKLSDFSEYRADTIARTETIGAYVNGDYEAAQLLGEFGPVEKVWVATGDARGREWHTELMDESIPFDEPFDVDGEPMMYPHDPSGSAFNVVNCRCYVEFLYVGDTRPDGTVIAEPGSPEEDQAQADEIVDEFETLPAELRLTDQEALIIDSASEKINKGIEVARSQDSVVKRVTLPKNDRDSLVAEQKATVQKMAREVKGYTNDDGVVLTQYALRLDDSWVARSGDDIVGAIGGAETTAGGVDWFYVGDLGSMRIVDGVGSQLFADVVKHADARGLPILLSPLDDAAVAWWESVGAISEPPYMEFSRNMVRELARRLL